MATLRSLRPAVLAKKPKKPALKIITFPSVVKKRAKAAKKGLSRIKEETPSPRELRLALLGIHSSNPEQASGYIRRLSGLWHLIPKRKRLQVVEEVSGNLHSESVELKIAAADFLGNTVSRRDGFFGYVKGLRNTGETDPDMRVQVACIRALKKIFSDENKP